MPVDRGMARGMAGLGGVERHGCESRRWAKSDAVELMQESQCVRKAKAAMQCECCNSLTSEMSPL